MKINRAWILSVLPVIGIICLSLYAYNQIMTKTTFGEAEIKNRVESLFNGEVQSVTKRNEQYEVTFSKNDFLYEVSVDVAEGTFSQIELIKEGKLEAQKVEKEEQAQTEKKEEEVQVEAETEAEKIKEENTSLPKEEEKATEQSTNEKTEAVKPLTKQEVIKIARLKFGGEVEEIQFVGTNDGGYYNVEMENDEDEATLQIHALTGAILTITYDD